MRRMAAVVEHERLAAAVESRDDRIDLFRGPVLILKALNHQHRARNPWQVFRDGPCAEPAMQPDVTPRAEHRIYVGAVVPRELPAQIGFGIDRLELGDSSNGRVFYEHMRRLDHHTERLAC